MLHRGLFWQFVGIMNLFMNLLEKVSAGWLLWYYLYLGVALCLPFHKCAAAFGLFTGLQSDQRSSHKAHKGWGDVWRWCMAPTLLNLVTEQICLEKVNAVRLVNWTSEWFSLVNWTSEWFSLVNWTSEWFSLVNWTSESIQPHGLNKWINSASWIEQVNDSA